MRTMIFGEPNAYLQLVKRTLEHTEPQEVPLTGAAYVASGIDGLACLAGAALSPWEHFANFCTDLTGWSAQTPICGS